MPLGLPGLFLVTAALYAAVGFGGGSTYNALLVLSDTDYRLIPIIALTCNLIVVSGGIWRFRRENALPAKRMLPFLATSVPAAWIGGRIPIDETLFVGLLGGSLLVAGGRLLLQSTPSGDPLEPRPVSISLSLIIGALIGALAGLVGIGGGIFLAPILYFLRWGSAREIAGGCSLFIFMNSVSGLSGQALKLGDADLLAPALAHWPLALAVLIGGQAGSWIGGTQLQPVWIKRLTAFLILYVAGRLLLRLVP